MYGRRATCAGGRMLTGSLEQLTSSAASLLLGTLDELQHVLDSILVARVDVEQDTFESHILVGSAVGILSATGRGKAEELREVEQAVVELLVGIGLGLLLELGNKVGLFLGKLIGEGLLLLGQADLVLSIKLSEESKLLVKLEELGLQGGLLEVCGLLVGIDDLERHQVVKGLGAVLSYQVVDLGSIGLDWGNTMSVSSAMAWHFSVSRNLRSSWTHCE